MAGKLLDEFKNAIGEVALVPSQGGVFEVTLAGDPVFSKSETGRFPSEGAVLQEVRAKL